MMLVPVNEIKLSNRSTYRTQSDTDPIQFCCDEIGRLWDSEQLKMSGRSVWLERESNYNDCSCNHDLGDWKFCPFCAAPIIYEVRKRLRERKRSRTNTNTYEETYYEEIKDE